MNTRRFQSIAICVVVAAGLVLAAAVPATALRGPGRHRGGQGSCPVLSIFDITEEQVAQFKQLKEQTAAGLQPVIAEIEALDVEAVLLAAEIDNATAAALLDEMVALQGQIEEVIVQAYIDGAQVLSAEQRVAVGEVVGSIADFMDYVADYPGWDQLKNVLEKYVQPMMLERKHCPIGLELTGEQETLFEELADDTEAAIELLFDSMRDLKVHETLLVEDIVFASAEAAMEELLDLRAQVSAIAAGSALTAVQILTPEQRETLADMMEHKQGRHGHHGRGKHGGGWHKK
ncbi:MAG: periplasmic heavy metal sensor [Deltaproteobacteria bacterium]|nr:periplasmic heavy metal sensor [Deltaproteobacteria bacterium]